MLLTIPGEIWMAGSSVIVALIGAAAVVYQSAKKRSAEARAGTAERELTFQSAALSFDQVLSEWSEIHTEILSLFDDTHIDRFLLLRAWNGVVTPRWTTAFFQIRNNNQKPMNYVHFELDRDYTDRLNHIVSNGSMAFKVSDLPESSVREIYQAEGVSHSAWFFVDKKTLPGSLSTAITYCSFATHSDEEITPEMMVRMRLIVSRMKGVASNVNGASDA